MSHRFAVIWRSPWLATLLAYGVSQVVIALGGFLRIPLIVNYLGAPGYGIVVAVTGLCGLVLALADGVTQSARVLAAQTGTGTAVSSIRELRRLQWVLFLAVLLAASLLVGAQVGLGIGIAGYIGFGIMGASLALPVASARGLLDALGKSPSTHIAQTSTALIGVPLLFLALPLSASTSLACFISGVGLALPMVVARLQLWRAVRGRPNECLCEPLAYRSFVTMGLWSGASLLGYAFDPAIVASLGSPSEAATFGLSARIMTIAMMLPLALTGMLTARFSALWALGDPNHVRTTLRRMTKWLFLAGVATGVLCLALSAPLTRWLGKGEIEYDLTTTVGLAVASLVSATAAPLTAALAVGRIGRARTVAGVACGGLNLCVSLALTPVLGAAGPAIGSAVAASVLALWLFTIARGAGMWKAAEFIDANEGVRHETGRE